VPHAAPPSTCRTCEWGHQDNIVGELVTQVATYLPSTRLVNITYHSGAAASRDALGRSVQNTELIGGVTNARASAAGVRARQLQASSWTAPTASA